MTIGNSAFCLFLCLTGVDFRGELQHVGDVSEQEIKRPRLKEARNSSKIRTSTLRKNDSSAPKNILQYTNEHTCDCLYYVTLLNAEASLFDFEG